MKELTTTSYALLGLLAIRSWSAYELAGQMKRGFAWYWPRAERAIYAEPKHLVEHGYARARTEHRGRQPRTVYAITPAGRRALRRWLSESSQRPLIESESLVRLTFLEHGDIDDAGRALAALSAAADELERIVQQVSGEYLDGAGPFRDRLPEIALTGRFLYELAQMYRRYATWAATYVDRWNNDDPTAVALTELAILNRATARLPA